MAYLESETSSYDQQEQEGDAAAWIFTFADMMTLILCFFVLLYSMSKLEVQKFKAIMSSVQSSFGEYKPSIDQLQISEQKEGQELESPPEEEVQVAQKIQEEKELNKMLEDIQSFVTKKGLDKHIILSVENGNIVLRVRDKALFPSGTAILTPQAKPILDDIIFIFNRYMDFRVRIAGHTDNIPINTVQFPSNWELSAIRATTVLRYIIDGGIETERLTATGYGELVPLYPNDTPERRAQNRRVEFVLEKEKR